MENQTYKTSDITNRKLEQSQTAKESHENRENPTLLPTPRDTPEEPEDVSKSSRLPTHSIEGSDSQVSSTTNPKRTYNKKLTEQEVLENIRKSTREERAKHRHPRRNDNSFCTEIIINNETSPDDFEILYASFAVSQSRRLHIDQLQKLPSHWETMLTHPKSLGFINAADR
ncbi:hypothetical protein GcC1_039043 [Golovinomyces cichoracearum]|uniref:Uncharacterized protein n=1 Tax=Golovinomyces cichoracearum TaxID=62708 RepID=A0A420J032_9PEZI|nr:hypothetical protein GcC1_039043 [Golovinomyces cichoracearum]